VEINVEDIVLKRALSMLTTLKASYIIELMRLLPIDIETVTDAEGAA
jgi:hypothetical protein